MSSVRNTFLAIGSSLILFTACKDKEDPAPASSDRQQLITSKSWRLSSTKFYGIEHTNDCLKDNVQTFNSDGTYVFSFGTNLCSVPPETASPATGTWRFYDNYSKLILGDNSGVPSDTSRVVELSASRLVVEDSQFYQGVEQNITVTFTAQ